MKSKKLDLLKADENTQELTEKFVNKYKDDGSLDTLDDSYKISFPMITVCQSLSEPVRNGEAKPGDFYDSISEKVLGKAITVTPILIFNNRLRWSKNLNETLPLCRSRDGITGVGDPGGECMKCPERKVWNRGKLTGTCDDQITMLIYIWDTETVSMLNFSRTKIKVARQMIKLLNAPPSLKLFCYAFKFTTAVEKSDAGYEYYNIVLDKFENNDKVKLLVDKKWEETLASFDKWHKEYKEQYKKDKINTDVREESHEQVDNTLKDEQGNDLF